MARPRRITDEQLADVARRAFLKHGPTVSTYAIAAQLGVSQAAVLKRTGTKENLLRVAFGAREPPPFLAALADGPYDGASLDAQLDAIARQMTAFLRELVPALIVLKTSGMAMKDLLPPGAPMPRAATIAALAGWLARGQARGAIRAGPVDVMAELIVGTLEARCFLDYIEGEEPPSARRRPALPSILATLWAGLAP